MPTITPNSRRAFTLAEMTVVVGLIALLTVGIGRLFAGVSDAVNRGLAVSDLDAAARALEESLRRDFARVNAMNSEDTFLVIRAIELGGDPERPVYLTAEDREADISDDLNPYEGGSRAIHTRLDEMAFLASSLEPLGFTSQQDAGVFTRGSARASAARVYYGHGLRPRLDPDWPLPESAPDDANTEPLRQFVSDGWFASRAGQSMDGRRTYLPDGVISGRNEFAADWVLARQALLLMGPEATGTRDPDNLNSPYAEDREYAPYIRDLETLARFWDDHLDDAPGGDENYTWPGPVNSLVSETTTPRPDQRLIAHGRVDVCAQSLQSVRGWLEGENPVWDVAGNGYSTESAPYTPDPTTAFGVPTALDQAVDDDRYGLDEDDLRDPNSATSVQRFLWKRAADAQTTAEIDQTALPPGLTDVGGVLNNLAYNHIAIRSALAGVLTRPLIDLEPAPESRADPGMLGGIDEQIRYAQEHDASMDTHAVIAPRCSRFEIAWSDGSTWHEDVDFDLDGVFDARAGERVWFDPTRIDPDNEPNDENAVRMTYEDLRERFTGNEIAGAVNYTNPDDPNLVLANGPLGGAGGVDLILNPEVGFGDADYFNSEPTFSGASASPVGQRLFVKTAGDFNPDDNAAGPSGTNPPYYNPDLTGGAPSADAWPDETPSAPSDDINEYLAVWPFRAPASSGQWNEPYEKNVWIRVRFTLHDPQDRVPGGRDYEVILHLNPQDEQS